MSIEVTALADAEPRPRKVAIGTFDGVHLGHQAVIEGADTVLTFEPHPLEVLHPAALPKLIMPFAIKRDVIEGLGVAELVVDPVRRGVRPALAPRTSSSTSWSSSSAPSRSRSARTSASAPRPRATRRCSAAHPEFETRVVPLVEVDGETVSSTRIRAQVAAGDMEGARHCLGAPFMVEGTVVKGDQRGRELGFPTANIVPDDRLVIPGHGVYAAFANGVPAAVNVGVRPDLRDRPRRPDRDLPDRPRRGPLRQDPAGRLRRAPPWRGPSRDVRDRRGAGLIEVCSSDSPQMRSSDRSVGADRARPCSRSRGDATRDQASGSREGARPLVASETFQRAR